MISSRYQRLTFFISMAIAVGCAIVLILISLKDHLVYFYAPNDITPSLLTTTQPFRLGGLVRQNSYVLLPASGAAPVHRFDITDTLATVTVQYQGLLPALFREGQGVIVEGTFKHATLFEAHTVLAKHDETYMPPEIARKLNQSHKTIATQSVQTS